MPGPNELEVDLGIPKQIEEVKLLRAELTGLDNQIKQLRSNAGDAIGGQRLILQGALSGAMSRASAIRNTLSIAESSGFGGAPDMAGAAVFGAAVGGGASSQAAPQIGIGTTAFIAWRSGIQAPGFNNGSALTAGGGWFGGGGFGGGNFGGGGSLGGFAFSGGGGSGFGGGPSTPLMLGPGPAAPGAPQRVDLRSQYAYGGAGAIDQFPMPWNRGTFQLPPWQNVAPGIYGAAATMGRAVNFASDRQLQGGDDPIARNQIVTSGIAATLGLVAGIAGGPIAGGVTYGIASTVLDPIGRYLAAPEVNAQRAKAAFTPYAGARYGAGGLAVTSDYTDSRRYLLNYEANGAGPALGGSHPVFGNRLDKLTDEIHARYRTPQSLIGTTADVAQGIAGFQSTLFNYGIDPDERRPYTFGGNPGRVDVNQPFADYGGRNYISDNADAGNILRGGSLSGGLLMNARSAIKGAPRRTHVPGIAALEDYETTAEMYTRRLGGLVGTKALPDTLKRIAPGFDPALGGNVADILGALGPENTATFLRIQNDDLTSAVDPMLLSRVSGQTRANTRLGTLGSLQPTGAAFAASGANLLQMQNLASLPGGSQSVSFAQEYSQYRSNRSSAFDTESLSTFGMRDLQISEQRKRLEVLPFSPGSIYGNEIASIANNKVQIGRLGGMLSLPDLSERERYQYTAEREGLITRNYESVGRLSEGFENRLPRLGAGTPAFFGRYNSIEGAAINLGRMHSPIRAYGAQGGDQRAEHEAFVSIAGGDGIPGVSSPYSRTADMNRTNDILERILKAITAQNGGSAGGHTRPSDARNGAKSDVSRGDLGQKALWGSH